jgi:hypothetical protein
MGDRTVGNSTLYEMAQTMVGQEDYTTAVALRKLAQAGYATLEQVDSTSDWVLLATPGIGIHRLTAVRRLVRPDWQPPPSRMTKVAERFLSTARFALRFWPIEDLEAVLQDSVSLPAGDRPIEKRLSLQQFAQAARKALRHCGAEELVQALQQACGDQFQSSPQTPAERLHSAASVHRTRSSGRSETSVPKRPAQEVRKRQAGDNSQHFAFSPEKRWEIVTHYRAAWANGEVANKEQWARANYSISAKTLLRYEREFPETAKAT